jgi:hypothetical protein
VLSMRLQFLRFNGGTCACMRGDCDGHAVCASPIDKRLQCLAKLITRHLAAQLRSSADVKHTYLTFCPYDHKASSSDSPAAAAPAPSESESPPSEPGAPAGPPAAPPDPAAPAAPAAAAAATAPAPAPAASCVGTPLALKARPDSVASARCRIKALGLLYWEQQLGT